MSESYDSKVIPVGLLDKEKLAVAVLLHVFDMPFLASLLQQKHDRDRTA